MFDTYLTVVGNVLNAPEWRRTARSGQVVVSFKVASTARRVNRDTGEWEDGNSLRVRVTCWRRLAEGVGASVRSGDPVVVVGRLYTRDWTDDNGARRLSYEMDAVAVGHDLARGRSSFERAPAAPSVSMVDDAIADGHVSGEPADLMVPRFPELALPSIDHLVPGGSGMPIPPSGGAPDLSRDGDPSGFDRSSVGPADLRQIGGGQIHPIGVGQSGPFGAAARPDDDADDPDDPEETEGEEPGSDDEDLAVGERSRRRRSRRVPVPA